MSLWIPVSQTFPTHEKTLLGAQLAQMDDHKFMGHLVQFWAWALDHTDEQGALPALPLEMLGQRAGLPRRQADVFMQALVQVGFVDGREGKFSIHNWAKFGGKLVAKRETEKLRIREKRGSNVASIERQRGRNVGATTDQRWPLDQIREEENRPEEKTK